jgi:SAM-dependent methyltransferase
MALIVGFALARDRPDPDRSGLCLDHCADRHDAGDRDRDAAAARASFVSLAARRAHLSPPAALIDWVPEKEGSEGTAGLVNCDDCVLRSEPEPSDEGHCWHRAEVKELRDWKGDCGDIRADPGIAWEILEFIEKHRVLSVGAPLERGITGRAMADTSVIFDDGAAYECFMGRWSRAVGATFLRWVAPPRGAYWLDVGCGTGVFTELVLDTCAPASIVAVDPAAAQIDHARKQAVARRADFRIADAQTLPFPDGAFDVVASALVINFIPDRPRALAEMRRVARPGGTVAGYVWDFAAGRGTAWPFWYAACARSALRFHAFPAPRTRALKHFNPCSSEPDVKTSQRSRCARQCAGTAESRRARLRLRTWR